MHHLLHLLVLTYTLFFYFPDSHRGRDGRGRSSRTSCFRLLPVGHLDVRKVVTERQKVDEMALAGVDSRSNVTFDAVQGARHHSRRDMRRLRTFSRSKDDAKRHSDVEVRHKSVKMGRSSRRRFNVGRRDVAAAPSLDGRSTASLHQVGQPCRGRRNSGKAANVQLSDQPERLAAAQPL